MAIMNILKDGDEILRKKSRPVTEITPRIIRLLDDMIETLHDSGGVGLAAPQVGVLRRIAVVECKEGEVYELINPKIVARSEEQYGTEGCLSVPGKWGKVRRPMHVTVQCLNRDGETVEYHGSELLARAFCHEIDHLDGKLFVDFVEEFVE